ncbi:MAG: O-sialoglycoprotein endopeptidase [Bacillota bacterium]
MELIMGIDTSNYTTSVAVLNSEGKLISEARKLLPVRQGERGLRQSEAVFKHVDQFFTVVNQLEVTDLRSQLTKIVVSTKPRPLPESYMPVFKVGESQARSMARVLDLPLETVSHQEGHLQAGIWSAGALQSDNFLAVHISGGTTEVLKVESQASGFKIDKLGAAVDIHAGQFIDRVGVELGLGFPAGPQLEELATQGEKGAVIIPSAVDGYQMSFSGPNSAAMRAIDSDKRAADIALGVQSCIAKTLEKVLITALEEHDLNQILIVGGVAANQYLRQRLKKRLEHPALGGKLFFAQPQFSSDNAVGVAALGIDN